MIATTAITTVVIAAAIAVIAAAAAASRTDRVRVKKVPPTIIGFAAQHVSAVRNKAAAAKISAAAGT